MSQFRFWVQCWKPHVAKTTGCKDICKKPFHKYRQQTVIPQHCNFLSSCAHPYPSSMALIGISYVNVKGHGHRRCAAAEMLLHHIQSWLSLYVCLHKTCGGYLSMNCGQQLQSKFCIWEGFYRFEAVCNDRGFQAARLNKRAKVTFLWKVSFLYLLIGVFFRKISWNFEDQNFQGLFFGSLAIQPYQVYLWKDDPLMNVHEIVTRDVISKNHGQ